MVRHLQFYFLWNVRRLIRKFDEKKRGTSMNLGRQWEERLRMWDEEFKHYFYQPVEVLQLEAFFTKAHLTLEQAKHSVFHEIAVGSRWGEKWEYGWFHTSFTIPKEVQGKRIMLQLGAGDEMLVFVNDRESGAIDKRHLFVEITDAAVAGKQYEIYAEVYAGHGPRLENGGFYPISRIPVPEPEHWQVTVKHSHYGIWNQEIYETYLDYHILYELLQILPETSLRAMKLAKGLKKFTYLADFELEGEALAKSIGNAKAVLSPLFACINGSTVPEYVIFGQSHLDLAWLWTIEETKRKAARTYSNQLALMERYPEYKFLLCEPPILEYLKKYYPELWKRVKEKVNSGQIVPEGGFWVESDTNLPGSESLIRQIVKGKLWYENEFQVDSKLAWLPDSFGFTGALPQILAGCKISYFTTQKLLRADPECEPFPYNNFWWEGIDGTRILSHIYKKNNSELTPKALVERWEKDRIQTENIDGMLFPFGYGDGGGGATETMLEVYERCKNLEGLPKCKMESPIAFFEHLKETEVTNVYHGELYLPWHRGTYTAQAEIKRRMRRAEISLRELECWTGILMLEEVTWNEKNDVKMFQCEEVRQEAIDGKQQSVELGQESEENMLQSVGSSEVSEESLESEENRQQIAEFRRQIENLWERVLFQQFHDILPGTSIQRVNEEARKDLEEVIKESRELLRNVLRILCVHRKKVEFGHTNHSVRYYFNSLSWDRSVAGVSVPACGYTVIEERTEEDSLKALFCKKCTYNGETAYQIQGEDYCCIVDWTGRIQSLKTRDGAQMVAKPFNQFVMYHDVNVDYDAWELGRMYDEVPVDLQEEIEVSELKSDDCKITEAEFSQSRNFILQIKKKINQSTVEQKIVFSADLARIEFHTTMIGESDISYLKYFFQLRFMRLRQRKKFSLVM